MERAREMIFFLSATTHNNSLDASGGSVKDLPTRYRRWYRHFDWSGEACVNSRRRVNLTVIPLLLAHDVLRFTDTNEK